MHQSDSRKKPPASFVVRLVGRGMRPWVVPMRALATILQAIQRLVEQRDEPEADVIDGEPIVQPSIAQILHLIDVKSGSASYAVSAPDVEVPLRLLSDLGKSIAHPDEVDWLETTLSSVQDCSEVARQLGCDVEFRAPGSRGKYGNLLAKITPTTHDEIEGSAYIHGETSIFAKVERVGGATEMHCGIRLPHSPRKMVICRIDSESLVRQLGQFMYEHVILHGKATWLRHNWKLKRLVIEGFDPPKKGSLMEALRRSHEAGGCAWDHIDDPNAVLKEMRG